MDDKWVTYSSLEAYSEAHLHQLDRALRTTSKLFIAPEVIRLRERDLVLNKKIALTRLNILMRDGCCGYCGATEELTVDHIAPRSRYKQLGLTAHTTWENTVACCRPCNNRKDDRTPEEAGMPLRIKPYKPHSLLTFTHTRKAAWLPYLGP